MKLGKSLRVVAAASALGMLLTGCGGGSGNSTASSTDEFDDSAKTTITFAGWSLDMTPEFKTLADGFQKAHPNVTVKIKQYSADDYDKQMTADISAGSQPDVFPIKNLQKYYSYSQSGGLADLSSVADTYKSDKNVDISAYKLDGKYFAMPYRADAWVLFYNKDMFDKTGVTAPDGTWTWDDYTKAAEELKTKLPSAGYDANNVYPMYMHNWQSVVQSFALAQSGKSADDTFFKANFNYMKPYYKRALQWQDDKLTIDWNTSSTSKVQYQAQFGTQKQPWFRWNWYAAALLNQQKTGDADTFNWGMVSIPQNPDASVPKTPITFGDPTGLAVSAKASGQEAAAAKEFVKWCTGEGGATVLAKIATTPAYFSDSVTDTFFATGGMPQDDLSKTAWSTHDTKRESPVGEYTDTIQSILSDTHSSIMTETQTVDAALAEASQNVKDQGAASE